MDRNAVFNYANEKYATQPEYPWMKYPDHAVLRHLENRKWYAVVMNVSKAKLGLAGAGSVDILNVKCGPMLLGPLLSEPGFLPAYHMNKAAWISIVLDDAADDGKIFDLLDLSYDMTGIKLLHSRRPDI